MIPYRAERGGSRGRVKLASLAVYNEDEANDLSDLGIGTSSASGKSSLSEDYDNNSVMVSTTNNSMALEPHKPKKYLITASSYLLKYLLIYYHNMDKQII